MQAIMLSFSAALAAALSNLFFRRNSVVNESANGHLACHYFVSFVLSFVVCSDVIGSPVNVTMAAIGGTVGLLNVVLMLLTYRALKRGPSGLTFALQNASCMFPGLILFLLFGVEFGFDFSVTQGLGIGLVIFGFFLATRNNSDGSSTISLRWLKYALSCFLVQALAFTLIQWRCLLFSPNGATHLLIPTTLSEESDIWFIPGLFGVATCIQMAVFLREKRWFKGTELFYGLMTGCANGLSTYLLTLATKWAGPQEQAILFPCFAVGNILMCNAWANKLYKERFDIWSNALCSLGIFVAAMS